MKKNNGGIMRIKDIFTKANCDYLKSLGETDDDILQIKQAYKVLKLEDKKGNKITKQQAIETLGIETFLSGLARASFHWTATRYNMSGNDLIYFDCSKLFE